MARRIGKCRSFGCDGHRHLLGEGAVSYGARAIAGESRSNALRSFQSSPARSPGEGPCSARATEIRQVTRRRLATGRAGAPPSARTVVTSSPRWRSHGTRSFRSCPARSPPGAKVMPNQTRAPWLLAALLPRPRGRAQAAGRARTRGRQPAKPAGWGLTSRWRSVGSWGPPMARRIAKY